MKFQNDLSRRVGKKIITRYKKKIANKIYLCEIGILFDDSHNMLDYPKKDFEKFEFKEFDFQNIFV